MPSSLSAMQLMVLTPVLARINNFTGGRGISKEWFLKYLVLHFTLSWIFCSLRSCQFCPFKLITQFCIGHPKKKLVDKKKFVISLSPIVVYLLPFAFVSFHFAKLGFILTLLCFTANLFSYTQDNVSGLRVLCLNFRNVYSFNLVILIGYLKWYFIPQ